MSYLYALHLAVTCMLAGLIWVIQIVIYPQFHRVGAAEFVKYHFAHCFRIGLVVTPLMLIEAGSAALLAYRGGCPWLFLMSLVWLPVVWLSTAIFQAPVHVRLMKGFEPALMKRLLWTNWLRTIGWTARGVLVACAAVS